MADRDRWVIDGTCSVHHIPHLSRINEWSELSGHPEAGPHILPGDLNEVLAWLHSDGRCEVGYFSIADPGIDPPP